MKRIILIISIIVLFSLNQVNAQAPDKINYQGVARLSNGQPMANQNISLRLSILNTSVSGNIVYSETHQIKTNTYGLYNLFIGTGTIVTGTMADIIWANGDKFLKVEIDPDNGTNFAEMGITQLISVPYALRAEDAGMVTLYSNGTNNPNTMIVSHSPAYPYWGILYNDPLDQISFIRSETSAAMTVDLTQRKVGIKTEPGVIPTADLEVAGTVKITGGNPGDGKVLVSDATGLTSWQDNSTKVTAFQPTGCQSLENFTIAYQKIGDMGTLTKANADTWLEINVQTVLWAGTFASGTTSVLFELRVDDKATTIGNATCLIKEAGTRYPVSITGVFKNVSAGNHTVSLWAKGVHNGGTDAMWDAGCYNSIGTNNVLVKEYR
jgi:hypothetical protein